MTPSLTKLSLDTAAGFEAFMQVADAEMQRRGYRPHTRTGMLERYLLERLGFSRVHRLDDLNVKALVGIDTAALRQTVSAWYFEVYGNQMAPTYTLGHVPLPLGHGVWRARIPTGFGHSFFVDRNKEELGRPATAQGAGGSYNVVALIEGVTDGLIRRLSDEQLAEVLDLVTCASAALQAREDLPEDTLFDLAKSDYACSTDNLVALRFVQSAWSAQQAAEKTMKGILRLAGIPYKPYGVQGHDLPYLGGLLRPLVDLNEEALVAANRHPKVRYGDQPCNLATALGANFGVLQIVLALSCSDKVKALTEGWWTS